jgi:Lrp/AsnC family transcriptional regulator for asnA, asnC and gidA
MGHHQIDKLDEQILKMIAENARIPFLEVARACNVSGAAIHQRIQKLTNLGILKGSEYVIDHRGPEEDSRGSGMSLHHRTV